MAFRRDQGPDPLLEPLIPGKTTRVYQQTGGCGDSISQVKEPLIIRRHALNPHACCLYVRALCGRTSMVRWAWLGMCRIIYTLIQVQENIKTKTRTKGKSQEEKAHQNLSFCPSVPLLFLSFIFHSFFVCYQIVIQLNIQQRF